MFIVYTGNRFNQILIFDSYDKAAAWLRAATLFTELQIARAIKIPHDLGDGCISVCE